MRAYGRELLEVFVADLIGSSQSTGSDERMYIDDWFGGAGTASSGTRLRHTCITCSWRNRYTYKR